eukprot:1191430-Amphidinium_carterae.1
MSSDSISQLHQAGFTTLSGLAYAITPGASDQVQQFINFSQTVLGADASNGEKALLRHAQHEAYALTVAHLKQRVEGISDDRQVSKLPPVVRESRKTAQQARLKGVDTMNGCCAACAPSNKVVDRVNQMRESDELRYEPWAFFNSRDSKIGGSKTEQTCKLDQGFLQISHALDGSDVCADTHDPFLARAAVKRRSLA